MKNLYNTIDKLSSKFSKSERPAKDEGVGAYRESRNRREDEKNTSKSF
jgi:hypothetical protein